MPLKRRFDKINILVILTIVTIVFFSLNTQVKAADVDTLSFPNFGSEFQVDNLNISYIDTDTIDATNAIMMYEKYSKVLSIDGSTITANSRSTVASANDEAQIEYLSNNKVVAGFNSTIGPNTVTDIGNTSANPTTWAGDQNMNSVLPRYIKMKTLDSTHVVLAYADNSSGNIGKVRVGTVGASTITWGTEATFNAGGTYAIGLAVLDSTHFVVTFRDTGDTNNGNAIVGSVSGTTISWETSETTFESGRAYGYMDAAALDNNKFIVVYNDGDNSSISNAIVGSYDGASTLTFGTKVVVSAAGSTFNTVDAIDDSHAILVWTNSSNVANANVATISGNEITLLDSAVAFDTGNIQYPSVTVLDTENFLIGYKDVTGSNYAKAIVGTVSWVVPTTLTQNSFRWYENTDAITPTTAYVAEDTNITAVDTLSDEDIVRLRISIQDGGAQLNASAKTFKLQFGTGDTCSAVSNWQDIGTMASTTAPWRGYNNASVADNATISSLVLSGSDVGGSYEEENNSATNPNIIAVDEDAEWDWVLQGHNFSNQTNYCFRMTESDGTVLDTYTNYPQINISNTPSDASSVTATYNSDIQITVTWTDNASDEDGFIIQRRDDTGSGWGAYAQIGTAATDTTSFVDNVANNAGNPPATNERYQYKIIAQNAAGNSSGAEAASSIDTTPSAPTIGAATIDSSTEITWTWTDNANFEDSYRIDYVTGTETATDIDDLAADAE